MTIEVAPNREARYTIIVADDSVESSTGLNNPPRIAGAAVAELPPADRLTHVAVAGQELPQKDVKALQTKLEQKISNVPLTPTLPPVPAVVEQSTTQPELISRRQFLEQAGGTSLRVGAPVVAVAAAVTVSEPEKAKHAFDFLGALGGLFNRLGNRKNQVVEAGAAIPGEIALNWQQMIDTLARTTLSDDQQNALEQLRNAPPEKLVHALEVGPDGAHLRRNPKTIMPGGDRLNTNENYLGDLAPGTKVETALQVTGEDPSHANDTRYSSNWYFIPTPDGKNGAFAWSNNFNNSVQVSAQDQPKP